MRQLGAYFPRRPNRLNGPLLAMLLNGVHDRHGGRVFVLHIGAGTGGGDPGLLPRFRDDGWSGLLVEPHPAYFAALEALHADSDRVAVLNLGISDIAGTRLLHALTPDARARSPGAGLNRASMIRDRVLVPGLTEADIDSVEIPVLRLDAVLGELGIDSAQLLVVNAGGHEAQILASFEPAALQPSLVLVRTGPGTPADAACVARLDAAGLLPFRVGDWLVALAPGALHVPLEELLVFFGRGIGQPEDPE
jgi:FkbM family methyltransferase